MRLLQGMRANFVAHGIDGVTATRKALGAVYGMVQQHAAMLAFVEAFWVMGAVFLGMLAFLPMLQYSKNARAVKPTADAEKAILPSDVARDWPDVPEHEVHEEDHDLVLH